MNPLGYRVVVKICKDNNLSEGGLYLPEGAKQGMSESLLAEVLEVASATDEDTDEEANVSGVPLGALVLIEKTVGVKIPWDDELRIVDTDDVLAIVSEVSLS
ncbi:MAG: co-chaperone GroES [Deltaproteobacteria bacterium]|nr:co-chaperone GroES [Deltaproteobacteria bacterium]